MTEPTSRESVMDVLWSSPAVLLYVVVSVAVLSGYLRNGWDGVAENLAWLVTPQKKAPKPVVVVPETPAPEAAVTVAGPRKTTYRSKYRTSHGGHAVGTLLTGGLWAPVWLVFATANKLHPGRKVTERHHY